MKLKLMKQRVLCAIMSKTYARAEARKETAKENFLNNLLSENNMIAVFKSYSDYCDLYTEELQKLSKMEEAIIIRLKTRILITEMWDKGVIT